MINTSSYRKTLRTPLFLENSWNPRMPVESFVAEEDIRDVFYLGKNSRLLKGSSVENSEKSSFFGDLLPVFLFIKDSYSSYRKLLEDLSFRHLQMVSYI